MAGPANQNLVSLFIPPGESQVQYPVGSLAREIQNMEFTQDNTLLSITGPTVYEPPTVNKTRPYRSETIHSVFHTTLRGGLADMLIVRWGDALYWHNGWSQTYAKIRAMDAATPTSPEPLSDERRTYYPDQYLVLNDLIIFTNGVDKARMITYEGVSWPLGFSTLPPSPVAQGPKPANSSPSDVGTKGLISSADNGDSRLAMYQHEPNYLGYSWPGKIGTIGDALDGGTGSVLAGTWFYHVQLEDFFGNLSALSTQSNAAQLATATANPPPIQTQTKLSWFASRGKQKPSSGGYTDVFTSAPDNDNTRIDDLTKQFAVTISGDDALPANTAAVHIYRTSDTQNVDTTPRLITRVAGRRLAHYPDNLPDAYLGQAVERTIPVPVFRVMCTHQGSLVIGNTLGEPGIVRRSKRGLPGTFIEEDFVFPDEGGAEVTAVTSHGGALLAFTDDSVISLADFSMPTPLSQGIGCVAPRSIVAMPDGLLIWLGRDGFYGLLPGGAIQRISEPIDRQVHHYLNPSRLRMAAATYNYQAREYQCAVSEAGSQENNLLLCFGEGGWRRKRLGMAVRDMCTTKDSRKYSLIAAKELAGITKNGESASGHSRTNDVYVLDRETRAYTPPDRVVRYRSNWLRTEKNALTPVYLRTMYVGMLDAFDGDVTIRFYRNGSWADVVAMADLKSVGPDDGQGIVKDAAGSAVIGTARTRDPRLFWRQVPVAMKDARIWAFEIETTGDQALHLAAIGFDVSVATMGNANSRTPRRSDV